LVFEFHENLHIEKAAGFLLLKTQTGAQSVIVFKIISQSWVNATLKHGLGCSQGDKVLI